MILVGDRKVGGDNPCFIVAEAGLAHEGRFELAKELINMAADAGADAVKFQVYRTKDLISKDRAPDWYERFERKELPYGEFAELKEYAEKRGIIWFATPHTVSAYIFLQVLGVPLYKVGSGERFNDSITKMVMSSGKPVFISLGMKEHGEIANFVSLYGGPNVAFLHCVTMYPVAEDKANMAFLSTLRKWCRLEGSDVGYSDHTPGTSAVEMAVVLGAKIIEKHMKVKESTGQDVNCSLDGMELKAMVGKIRQIERMMGSEIREYSAEERESEKWALKGKDQKRPPY